MQIELRSANQPTKPQYTDRFMRFAELLPNAPKFRREQIEHALLAEIYTSWSEITTLSKVDRELLTENLPWLSIEPLQIQKSERGDTYKAAFRSHAGDFESVLMANKRGDWTICVSSQIGCAMGCSFCATGRMGFRANLHADQIIDQYRYWNHFVKSNPKEVGGRISNIVFMGMGEPLANYPNVKLAINTLLQHTDLGPTRITVSSVGVLPALKKILKDPDWPGARIAISLHSANSKTRSAIIRTSYADFLPDLQQWCLDYLDLHGNRRHHITFEYVMLNEVNDSPEAARDLIKYVNGIGKDFVKVNLIPYNWTDANFVCSTEERFVDFMQRLRDGGINVTRRKTMGDDIDAACGQLITLLNK